MFPLPGFLSDSSSSLAKPVPLAVAAARVDRGVGVATVAEREPGVPDNEVRIMVDARARRGDVTGAVDGVFVNAEALERGVDVVTSPTEAFVVVEILPWATIDENPERNALTNGLNVEKVARGWVLVAFVTGGCSALAAGLRRNRSIWSSVMATGGDEVGRGRELLSSPGGLRDKLWEST